MTAYEEYQNRVKVAIEKAYVTETDVQILLDGVVKILGYQDGILKTLTCIYSILQDIHKDIPS